MSDCKYGNSDLQALAIASVARQRVVLLNCGSFNPPTIMHLRMFELAKDFLNNLGHFQVIGGIMSPVHDAYGKKGLVCSSHRVEMLKLALEKNTWVKISSWESEMNDRWSRTRQVLEYHQQCINNFLDGSATTKETWMPTELAPNSSPVTLKLLCGADVLDTFNVPGIWKPEDIEYITKDHGIVAISRHGCDPFKAIHLSDHLYNNMKNINVVKEWISNEISSTEIRRAWKRNLSIRYLVPDSVIEYMDKQDLYRE